MDQIDINETAQQMVEQHGPEAPKRAAMNAELMEKNGDLDGLEAWNRVIEAIEILLKDQAPTIH